MTRASRSRIFRRDPGQVAAALAATQAKGDDLALERGLIQNRDRAPRALRPADFDDYYAEALRRHITRDQARQTFEQAQRDLVAEYRVACSKDAPPAPLVLKRATEMLAKAKR